MLYEDSWTPESCHDDTMASAILSFSNRLRQQQNPAKYCSERND